MDKTEKRVVWFCVCFAAVEMACVIAFVVWMTAQRPVIDDWWYQAIPSYWMHNQ